MGYILLVDDETELLTIHEMLLKASYSIEIATAGSGSEALAVIKRKGIPSVIVSDFRMPNGDGFFLYQSLKELKCNVPFIVCSGDPIDFIKEKFPDVHGYIEKPDTSRPLLSLLKTIICETVAPPEYVPVRYSLLMNLTKCNFDIYIKLSESRYVKVLHAGETFGKEELERFKTKNIENLFIKREEAVKLINELNTKLVLAKQSLKNPTKDFASFSIEALRSSQRLANVIGWTPEVVNLTKQGLDVALKTIAENHEIQQTLVEKLKKANSKLWDHSALIALLSCHFCQVLGWASEFTQTKISIAAILHDIVLDERFTDDAQYWNERARNKFYKDPDTCFYRNHPLESVKMLKSMKDIPSDVDHIILQHHENAFGSGFPHQISASKIHPLSALFMFVEDFVENVAYATESSDQKILEMKIKDFFEEREKFYPTGNLKKVFQDIKKSMKY